MDSRSLIFVTLAACSGPRASVENAQATRSPLPGATRVMLDIVNKGGEGTVDVKIELRSGDKVIRADETVDVQPKQTIHFEKDVPTPPGDYSVTATAEFPD